MGLVERFRSSFSKDKSAAETNQVIEGQGKTTNAADKNREVVLDSNGKPITEQTSSQFATQYNKDSVDISNISGEAAKDPGPLGYFNMGKGQETVPSTNDRMTDAMEGGKDATVPGLFSTPLVNAASLSGTGLAKNNIDLGKIDLTNLKTEADIIATLKEAGITCSVKDKGTSETRFLLPGGAEGSLQIKTEGVLNKKVVEVVQTIRNGEQLTTATYVPGKGTTKETTKASETFADVAPLLTKAPDKMVLETVERLLGLGQSPTVAEMKSLVGSVEGMFKESMIRLLESKKLDVKEVVADAVAQANKAGHTNLARVLEYRNDHHFHGILGLVSKEQQGFYMRLATAIAEPRSNQGSNGDIGKFEAIQHVLDSLPQGQEPLTPKQVLTMLDHHNVDVIKDGKVYGDLEFVGSAVKDKVKSLLDEKGLVAGPDGKVLPREQWEEAAKEADFQWGRRYSQYQNKEYERPPEPKYEKPATIDLGAVQIGTHSMENGAHTWTGKLDGKLIKLRETPEGGLELIRWNEKSVRFENVGPDGKPAPPEPIIATGNSPKNPPSDPGMHIATLVGAAQKGRERDELNRQAQELADGPMGYTGQIHAKGAYGPEALAKLQAGEAITLSVETGILGGSYHTVFSDRIGGNNEVHFALKQLVSWFDLCGRPMTDPAAKPPPKASEWDLTVFNLSKLTGDAYSLKPGESAAFIRFEDVNGKELSPWAAREAVMNGGKVYATPMTAGASKDPTTGDYGKFNPADFERPDGIGWRAIGPKEEVTIDNFLSKTAELKEQVDTLNLQSKLPGVSSAFQDPSIPSEKLSSKMDATLMEKSVNGARESISPRLETTRYSEELKEVSNGEILRWEQLKGLTMEEFASGPKLTGEHVALAEQVVSLKDKYGFELIPSRDGATHYYRTLPGGNFQEVIFKHRGSELESVQLRQGGNIYAPHVNPFDVTRISSEVTIDYTTSLITVKGELGEIGGAQKGGETKEQGAGEVKPPVDPNTVKSARETIISIAKDAKLEEPMPAEGSSWAEFKTFHRKMMMLIHTDRVPPEQRAEAEVKFKEYMKAASTLYPDNLK